MVLPLRFLYREKMEEGNSHPLLQVTQEDIIKTREFYNLNERKIKDFINAIEEWCKKQDHLVEASKYLTHDIIERLICQSRGSLEATKTKIDSLLTTRGLLPHIISNRSVEEFEDFLKNYAYVPLPKMDKEQTRVSIIKSFKENWADFDLLTYVRYSFLVAEYRINFDYSLQDIIIIDFKFFSRNDIMKLNPVVLRDADILARKVYGLRIKSVHILNAPPYVDLFVSIYKQMVSEKLASRMNIHTSYETIYDYVSKEILPEDYGGSGPSIAKLQEQWKESLKSDEGRKILENSNNLKSDESRRNCAKFNEEYLGMPGSFTKLNVD